MQKPLNIAIAGLGIVGSGTLDVLQSHTSLLEARCGRTLNVVAVSARDKGKKRPCDTSGLRWVENPLELAQMPEVDVIVELIGGSEGVARALVEAALKAGKHVVTANKALIAHHGMQLAQHAEAKGVMFAYEAAVAGGIPIIKSLREGLAANRFHHVVGILNGTCNFILTSMWDERQDFPVALKEAQRSGFAEADPTFDIDGIDSAHKLAIITSLAYGSGLAIDAVYAEGIRRITLRDMEFADQLGYVIKLLGISSHTGQGVMQRVHPCMIPKQSTLGRVNGAYNAVIVEGEPVGRITLEGAGAGAGPTASSVVGDIVDIARGAHYKPFTIPVAAMQALPQAHIDTLKTCYYLRLAVVDRPGVLASVTAVLRDEGISLRSFLQHSHTPGEPVQVVLTTHETLERSLQHALKSIAMLDFVLEAPHMIRIVPL
jgi:homoserine dehydrogenase